jgi:DNA helicase-2/ATP-dependent DNA helicase PcrA
LVPADDLLALACNITGLSTVPRPTGDSLLAGAYAVLDPDADCIWHDSSLTPETTRFNIAHELGHWWLHEQACACMEEDIVPDPVTEPLPYGESYVSGYGPAQRREVEANVFAAEFLLPAPLLREMFLEAVPPKKIAQTVGISESTVLSQMAEALLLPIPSLSVSPSSTFSSSSASSALDASQQAAAELESGPALIVAGPGTGKTRTLIARVLTLLNRGVRPEQILALTFSNRAAEEMRERLGQAVPDAARRIWIGTFHSFGLELLRRFGPRIGLPATPSLLDPLDAVALLERHLVRLELREYEFLHNPAFPLREILGAISRAKDELKPPEEYARLAELMTQSAFDEESIKEAARAVEVSRVYAVWQRILQEEGKLDFGDLLSRAVELLQTCPDVQAQLQKEYRHILVDEYQDINRASAVLVKLVAGEGQGLWTVGDLRQAIYRFRGASPANLSAFERDYAEGRRLTLDVNYRSRPEIVSLFDNAARQMTDANKSSPDQPFWTAQRGVGARSIVVAEADCYESQAAGIAELIRGFNAKGIAYSDQAVLCRTNSQAEALAAKLEERDIPILYLGDLFARPEIKDMLALLSLASEGHGQGLLRMARFPEYNIPAEVAHELLEKARAAQKSILSVLGEDPRPKIQKLHGHIAPIAYAGNAAGFMARYLFGPADYLRRLVREDSIQNRQRRIALYQLLLLARGFATRMEEIETNPQRAFLKHVRHLLATQEDSRARIPAGAEIDGVRLMTVHASKGLEFPVVFLPNLAKDLFPSRGRSGMVRLPPGLIPETEEAEESEEERLFFVALSRARDHLILSRPQAVNGKPRDVSRLLSLVEPVLSGNGVERQMWVGGETAAPTSPISEAVTPHEKNREYSLSEVEQYMRCPRQYYYSRFLRLPTGAEESAYLAFHVTTGEIIKWLRTESAQGHAPSNEEIAEQFEIQWAATGPGEHPHAPLFRARAQEIVSSLASSVEPASGGKPVVEELVATLESGRIILKPDYAEETEDGRLVVERHHTGRASADHPKNPRLALLRLAAKQHKGGTPVEVHLKYPASGETQEVPEKPRYEPARIEKYEQALRGIQAGEFPPRPSDQECPNCPFYFICPL